MIKLKKLLLENEINMVKEFLDSFLPEDRSIIEKYAEKLWKDFQLGKKPSWTLIRRSDALELWKEFGKYRIITEQGVLQDMIDLTLENAYKILGNTLNIYKINQQGGHNGQTHPYFNDAKYTDGFYNLNPCLIKLKSAITDEEKLMALDYTFNVLHSCDYDTMKMTDWFIQGGNRTLEMIKNLREGI